MKFAYVLVVVSGLILVSSAFAAEEKVAPVELKNQTHCPVMGGKIDSAVYTDIQGQRVYHCCPGCQSKLTADPDKYFKKAFAQGIVFENIQTACPVTGKPIDTSFVTNYEGRRIYFATKEAIATFSQDPAKYLAILDEQSKAKEEKRDAPKHEDGAHSH